MQRSKLFFLLIFIISGFACDSCVLALSFSDSGQSPAFGAMQYGVLADFTGDGLADIGVALNGANKIWTNNGSGVFTNSGQSLDPNNSQGIAVADFDNDGDLDIAFGNDDAGATVWVNNGTGTFSDSGQSLGAGGTMRLAALDIDQDGDMDLFEGRDANPSKFWINDGSGIFTESSTTINAGTVWHVKVSDLNGDGFEDLIVANSINVTVYYSDGKGGFGTSDALAATGEILCLHDYNADNLLDIANFETSLGSNALFRSYFFPFQFYQNLSQAFGNYKTGGCAAADLDNDGDIDLAQTGADVTTDMHFWLNDGSMSFSAATDTHAIGPSSLLGATDTDGDGDVDLVIYLLGGTGKIYLNDTADGGNANAAPTAPSLSIQTIGVFERTPKLQWSGETDDTTPAGLLSYELRMGAGAGAFDTLSAIASEEPPRFRQSPFAPFVLADGAYYWSVRTVDASYDRSSWAVENSFTISSYLWQKENPITVTSSSDKMDMIAADFDSDGDIDIFTASSNAAQRKLYNNGGGALTASAQNFNCTTARAADADGDGDVDIMCNNDIYRNNGAGIFTASGQSFTLQGFCAGDLDGDGDTDLAGGGAKRVYLNNGAGVFGPTIEGSFGACVHAACGDLDGDGDTDVAMNVCNTAELSLWENDGKAGFGATAWQTLALDAEPSAVDFTDLDADGDLDIVYNTGAPLMNNGGAFTIGSGSLNPGLSPTDLVLGDLNNDGWTDAYVTAAGTGIPRLNTGAGGYQNASEYFLAASGKYPAAAAAADMDADGYLDIVTAAGVTMFNDSYNGPPAPAAANTIPSAPTVADLTDTSTSTIHFSWSQGADAQTPNALITYNVRIGTVSGGNDIYSGASPIGPGLAGASESLTLKNMPEGTIFWSVQSVDTAWATSAWSAEDSFVINIPFTFTESTDTLQTLNTASVFLADVNSATVNGSADVITASQNGATVLVNSGAGTFAAPAHFGAAAPTFVTAADLDGQPPTSGSGGIDLIVCYNGMNTALLNNGAGSFSATSVSFGAGDTSSAAAFDADGDGDADVVFGNRTGISAVFLNNGDMTFTQAAGNLGNDTVNAVVHGDVDGDADTDIILVINGDNLLFTNDGRGAFTDSGQNLGAGNSLSGALVDTDADGDLDFIEGSSGANRIWLNNGSGTFTDSGAALGVGDTVSIVYADFDNDGDWDFFAANKGSASKMWLNDGAGNFTDFGSDYAAADTVTSAAAADLDGDGDVDIYLGILGQDKVLFNSIADAAGGDSPDTLPSVPSVIAVGNPSLTTITLQWTAASDVETPLNQITYNVCVGKTPGGGEELSCHTGIGPGNSGATLSHRIDNVYPGTYYWSVQSVDGAFRRSAFSSEDTFNNIAPFDDTKQTLGNAKTRAVFSADVNNDGDIDVIAGNDGASKLWVNDGAGVFTDSGQNLGSHSTIGVYGGDFDNNGYVDLVKAEYNGAAHIYLNSVGVFTDTGQALDMAGLDVFGVTGLDADGDGDIDLAFATHGDNRLFINNGAGVFTDSGAPMPGTISNGLAAVDIDRDGDMDLVDATTSGVRLWSNNGFASFTLLFTGFGTNANDVAAADVNGDGITDIIRGGSLGTNIFTGNGNGAFNDTGATIPTTAGIFSLHPVDADLDGDFDILASTNLGTYLFLNDGAGAFTDSKQVLGTNDTRAITSGDFDADSDPDLYAGNYSQPNKVWENWRISSESPISPNIPPSAGAPAAAAPAAPGRVRVSWAPGSDMETPASLLRYNVRVGTTAGSANVYSGSIQDGLTTAGATTSFSINLSSTGTYYFAVQTIDSAQKKSSWSSDGTIAIDADAPVFAGLAMAQDLETGGAVRLSWSAATDSAPPITYYAYYSTATRAYNYASADFATTGFCLKNSNHVFF